MRKGLYLKLAIINIKNHRRLFVPYMLCCSCCAAMLCVMMTLTNNSKNIMTRGGATTLGTVLSMGVIVVALFSVFITFYANSFIIKRRKKEFGLYNVLGMEKRHIARVMGAEAVVTGLASIVAGIAFAALFAKLLVLILFRIVSQDTLTSFNLSANAAIGTAVVFACVYVVIYVWNVSRVGFSSAIELLRGGDTGEKEPKAKWLITVIGVLTLGYGYYMALTTREPAMALALFFVAVILVIIGTYCLFTSGSISVLKALKRNRRYYYQPKHFTSVAGMIYRMKQNAVGLANICILSTMVLVMLSSTMCLYSGMENSIRLQYPRNITVNGEKMSNEAYEDFSSFMDNALGDLSIRPENMVKYRYVNLELSNDGEKLMPIYDDVDFVFYSKRTDVYLMPIVDYVALSGSREAEIVKPGQALVYRPNGEYGEKTIAFGDAEYDAIPLDSLNIDEYFPPAGGSVIYVVVPSMDDVEMICKSVDYYPFKGVSYRVAFDVSCSDDEQIEAYTMLRDAALKRMADNDALYSPSFVVSSSAADAKSEYMGLYGGLLFLGIFLGLMFTMAAALIMYYRQISEGYDDSRRYEIMINVGMSLSEVAGSIRSQVLTVFFLPLIAAGVHIAMAFPMISAMFKLLRLDNVPLFAQSTAICFGVFAVLYLIVYALTARTYYKIVSRPAA